MPGGGMNTTSVRTWAKGVAMIRQMPNRTYELQWWNADPLRSPNAKIRRGCTQWQAARFAKRHKITDFFTPEPSA
ncbi:MAG: hypothetical protein C0499_02635 [Zymomonas sp.]|nr:hypothetical protein [Zymomonas sp.]